MAKRLFALLLVVAMLLSFAACGETPTNPTEPTNPSTPTEPTTPSNPTEPSEPATEPTEPATDPTEPTEPAHPWDAYNCITVADALAMQLSDGQQTEERFYLRGTVEKMLNVLYGEMNLTDETGTIYVYGTYSEDGALRYSEMTNKAFEGDEVLLHCVISKYQGTIQVKNARLIDYIHVEEEIDETDYTQMSIADVRDTAIGTKVKVTGVVAQITYANGRVPSGVILVDGTSSIYLYDSNIAGRVAIGNEISVLASKTYWVLADEQANAAKFGYIGCNQLENATLVSNDNGNHDFDKSWITESTVKEIMDTPVSTDISTLIFKVTAYIKEVPGNGFTNYYLNDLDGYTGNYCYSQCNGGDFEWLRQYDGKICTVYMMALNAKSTGTDCFWRFLPVAVIDEGFDPATVNFAENAVKLYAVDQFLSKYTGNPKLELMTSVDNEILGYTGVALSYASSDASVISIDGNVMNCRKTGTAVITITGEYNGVTYSQDVTIEVEITEVEVEYPTVADVIATEVGQTITVKGIVGPSLVNKTGFYLIDETGVIAVITDADTLATLKIGDEVALEALRDRFHNGGSHAGQTCITNAKVITNNYGSNSYSTASFAGEISVVDFSNLDAAVDYSTTVYTMKAKVLVEETAYYTSIYLVDGNTKVSLYCSSAKQYNWLREYEGQEVTVEIAACNWNNKTYWRGCVLAVVHEDGTKTVNNLNFQ